MKVKQQPSTLERNPACSVQKKNDFSHRDLYVGINVHKQRWQIAVYYEGLILSNASIEASSDSLIAHLRKYYGDAHFSCVYESGPFGFALCRSLWAAGIDCMVVNPADIPDTDKNAEAKPIKWMPVSWP